MTKKIIEKLQIPFTPIGINEMSAEQKKALLLFLLPKGFSIATFYKRFFQKGFSAWELIGVKECKKQFLSSQDVTQKMFDFYYPEHNAPKDFPLTLADGTDGAFYSSLKKVNQGLCGKFASFMKEKGMSERTTCTRFTTDKWKEWEITGIAHLLKGFLNEID